MTEPASACQPPLDIDLFAGGGGLAVGLKLAGFSVRRTSISFLRYTYKNIHFGGAAALPKLDTPAEIRLKRKLSEEKVRRLQKDIQREKQRQQKFDVKLKAANKRARD